MNRRRFLAAAIAAAPLPAAVGPPAFHGQLTVARPPAAMPLALPDLRTA
jgi:hypothetical protein